MKDLYYAILMFASMLFWGLAWINAKVLSNYLDSYNLIFWRFLIASVSLLPVAWFMGLKFKISLKTLLLSFITAILMLMYNYAFFEGTKYGNAGFGGVLVTTLNPILTFFVIAILAKKNLTKKEYLALFLGAVGSLIMLEIWKFGIDIWFKDGIKYFLMAAILWVFVTVASSKNSEVSSIIYSFYVYIFMIIIDYVFVLNFSVKIESFDYIFWLNLFAVSLLAVTFATTVYFLATTKRGSKYASAFIFLVPFSAAIFAYIFLGEKLKLTTIIGGVIVMAAIYILQGFEWHKRNK